MPDSHDWFRGLPSKEKFPIELRKHFGLLCDTVLKGAELEQRVLELLIGAYQFGKNGELTQKDIASILYENDLTKGPGKVRQIITQLRLKLPARVQDHPSDPIRILLPKPETGYRLVVDESPAAPSSVPNDGSLLEMLEGKRPDGTQKEFHAYHLTVGPTGDPMWSYQLAKFYQRTRGGPPIADVIVLPEPGITDDVERNRHRYTYEASAPLGTHQLVIHARQVGSSRTDFEGVAVFPNVFRYVAFPWCGIEVIYRTFESTPASSICMLADVQLECARNKSDGRHVADGDPIKDRDIIDALNAEWEFKGWKNQKIKRLPPPPGSSIG